MARASFDVRSGINMGALLVSRKRKIKSLELTIFCTRATRSLRRVGVAWPVLLLAEQRRGWSLMIFCARATRGRGSLARVNGTSRRASGWAGEKVARSGRSISPHP